MATVVRVRQLQDRVAEAEVVRRNQVVRDHIAGIDAAVDSLSNHHDRPDELTDSTGLHRRDWSLRGAFDDIAHRNLSLKGAEADKAQARAEWFAARQRRDAVERLSERHRKLAAIEDQRNAQKELDDLVSTRHGRKTGMTP